MNAAELAVLQAAGEKRTLRVQYGNQGLSLFNEDVHYDNRTYVSCDYTKRTDAIRALESRAREYVSCG